MVVEGTAREKVIRERERGPATLRSRPRKTEALRPQHPYRSVLHAAPSDHKRNDSFTGEKSSSRHPPWPWGQTQHHQCWGQTDIVGLPVRTRALSF